MSDNPKLFDVIEQTVCMDPPTREFHLSTEITLRDLHELTAPEYPRHLLVGQTGREAVKNIVEWRIAYADAMLRERSKS